MQLSQGGATRNRVLQKHTKLQTLGAICSASSSPIDVILSRARSLDFTLSTRLMWQPPAPHLGGVNTRSYAAASKNVTFTPF